MLKQVGTSDVGSGDGGGNNRGRVCDTCGFAACTVFSRAESAYLCAACDAQLHAAKRVASPHELVRVCEACERAPAAFLCKADASSLCTTCDAEIHSTNPLARRHQRVPILPISGRLYGLSAFNQGGPKLASTGETEEDEDETIAEEDEDEAASWLPLNPGKNSGNNQNNGFLLGGEEVDEYLDLEEYNSSTVENQLTDQYNQKQQHYGVQNKGYGGDSIAPVQSGEAKDHLQQQQHQSFQYGLDYDSSKSEYSYNGSVSHSVSLSSVDVGVAPESTISDISASQTRPPKGTIDIFCGAANAIRMPLPPHLKAMDREARVLRYREKKKTRKFEKTIRYVSRKAYAETRPRIKGRFAKRTDVEVEADRCSRQH